MAHDIAIVGMAGRFPGAPDLATFWENLLGGVESVARLSEADLRAAGVPADLLADPAYVRASPLLDGHDRFDAGFFRYSQGEASALDPQHRLLHELAWEALEDAGWVPEPSRGTVGIVAGCGPNVTSYAMAVPPQSLAPGGSTHISTDKDYLCTRVSHRLDLRGPSFTVQTACSSSLVAVHLAVQMLALREADVMLAGGVNVRTPQIAGYLHEPGGIVSADGRCLPFDARADGTLFGSGGALLALRRLDDAIADGDLIYAVIKGSAVNNDGAIKLSYAASAREGQIAVVSEALAVSGVEVESVGLVETHGTATAIGDPIEFQALSRVFRARTASSGFCALGALKANIGHLDAAAGVAGLVKAALALHRGVIPPAAYFGSPNPKIRLEGSPFFLPVAAVDWPRGERPRAAGVSAFGIGGTNAHVVIQEAPPQRALPASAPGAQLLLWSARDPVALGERAARAAAHLRAGEAPLAAVCATSARRRAHLEHRAALVGSSAEALSDALARFAGGEPGRAVVGESGLGGRVAFLFTGQGAQRPGMGEGLYRRFPVFREALDRCVEGLRGRLDRPLPDVMWARTGSEAAALLDRTEYTQPALFAFEYALFALWRAFGARPDRVAGHSIGQIAAATAAGVLSLEDALELVAARGALVQSLPGGGAMAALDLPEVVVAEAIGQVPAEVGRVELAAVNAPERVVISGDEAAVSAVCERFAAEGVRAQRLAVSHAFHSHRMAPIEGALAEIVSRLALRPPRIPLVSDLDGTLSGDELLEPSHWGRHLRGTVRFADAVAAMLRDGVETFVEIGPRPTLLSFVSSASADPALGLLASVRPGQPEDETLLAAFGGWYVRGGAPDWGIFPDAGRARLPTYPFQRQRYGIEARAPRAGASGRAGAWALGGLGQSIPGGLVHRVLEVGPGAQAYLADHVVHGEIVVPGAFFLSCLLAAGSERWPGAPLALSGVEFVRALVLEAGAVVPLHLLLRPTDGPGMAFEVATPGASEADWVVHVRGAVAPEGAAVPQLGEPADGAAALSVDALYGALASVQVAWGPRWRWFQGGQTDGEAASGAIAPPAGGAGRDAPLHPTLLDNALGLAIATVPGATDEPDRPLLPFAVERLVLHRPATGSVRCVARSRPGARGAPVVAADLRILDGAGLVASIEGLTLHRAAKERLFGGETERLGLSWEPLASSERELRGRWLALARSEEALERLTTAIVAAGGAAIAARIGPDLDLDDPGRARSDLAKLLGTRRLRGVAIDWRGEPGSDRADEAERLGRWGLCALLALGALAEPPPVWWLSCPAGDPAQAVLGGLGRVWQREQPERPLVLVDLDPSGEGPLAAALGARDEGWIRLGADGVSVPRLAPAPPSPGSAPGVACITGGTGALGLCVARWLAEQGTRQIVLVARREPTAPARRTIEEIERLGARVRVVTADVADLDALRAAFDALPPDEAPDTVIHAAGVLDDGVFLPPEGGTAVRLGEVFAPKVRGAWNLHQLSRGWPIERFVLFSSIAGVWGSPGQGAYAAANAWLDALAEHRISLGLPALSLRWGPWGAIGMAAGLPEGVLSRQGLRPLPPRRALALLGSVLGAQGERTLAAIDASALDSDRAPAVARRLAARPVERRIAAQGPDLRSLPPEARHQAVLDIVRGEIARAAPSGRAIEDDTPLRELGIDSLIALELRRALSQRLGVALSPTLTFDHPNIGAVTRFLLTRLSTEESP